MTDYVLLSDRELDVLVAERVMGTPRPGKNPGDVGPALFYGKLPEFPWFADASLDDPLIWEWCSKRAYSTDENAARMVRDRIAELGLKRAYLETLWKMLNLAAIDTEDQDTEAEWRMNNATARQQMIAALIAKEGKDAAV